MAANSLLALMKQFDTEEKCVAHLASIRWPNGPVCQHCRAADKVNPIKTRNVFWCGHCKKQFSVRVGTIFEESRLPLNKWFAAIWLATSHKKGISSVQLAKDIDVTQKTAWHMLSRMRDLQRYLDEFAARYNTRDNGEGERFNGFLAASIGRRLTYAELIA